MNQAVQSSVVHHFADDTNLLYSNKDPKIITTTLNRDLQLLFEWLCANRLSLNVAKTEFIAFRPPKRYLTRSIVFKLNGIKIFESPKIKYLGVILDPFLSWKHHINELTKNLNRAVGMIYKIRCNCTGSVLQSLYFSLFHSHLSYALSIWGTSTDGYLSKLRLLQKRIVRSITFSDFNAHTTPLYKDICILTMKDLFSYTVASLMWDFDHSTLPDSLNLMFTRRNEIHTRKLRDNNKNKVYTAHRFKNRHGCNSFSYYGALLLNKLKDLPFYENCHSKKTFQLKYKSFLLESY